MPYSDWRQNKSTNWSKPNNILRNCYEIEFIEFDWSHETILFVHLKERDLFHRIDICDLLLKYEENDLFLKRIVTGDKKWIIYDNVKRKRSRSNRESAQANIYQKKVMFSDRNFFFLSFYLTIVQLIWKCTAINWTN